MAWLDDYRKANPWADKYSDKDIVNFEAGQSGTDPIKFAKAIGVPMNQGTAADFGTDLKRGFQQLPGAAAGLVDIPVSFLTGRGLVSEAADAVGDATGFKPGRWANNAELNYSQNRQLAEREIDNAWKNGDAGDIAGAYLTNPGATTGKVIQSIPSMIAGGAIGRGLMTAGRGAALGSEVAGPVQASYLTRAAGQSAPYYAAAAGEGSVAAGQNMQQSLDAGVDPRRAAATSLASGVGTGILGYAGGRVANRLGLGDLETTMVGGIEHAPGTVPSLPRRVAGGAFSEGVLEEAPQSMQEQMWQNVAEGKPLTEGVWRQGVEGAITGGVMGGGVNMRPAPRTPKNPVDPSAETDILGGNPDIGFQPLALPKPVYTGTPNESILNYEVDRANEVGAAERANKALWELRQRWENQQNPPGQQDLLGDPLAYPINQPVAQVPDAQNVFGQAPAAPIAPTETTPNRRQMALDFSEPNPTLYGNQYNPATPSGPNGVQPGQQAGVFTQLPVTDNVRTAPTPRQQAVTAVNGVKTVEQLRATADQALASQLITPEQHVDFMNEVDTNRRLKLVDKRGLLSTLIQGNQNGNQETVDGRQEGTLQAGQPQGTVASREVGIPEGTQEGRGIQQGRQGQEGLLNGIETQEAVAPATGQQAAVPVPRSAKSVASDVESFAGNTKDKALRSEASRLYNDLMVDGSEELVAEAERFLEEHSDKSVRKGTKDFRNASPRDKAIIFDRLGWDEEGNQVGSPMTQEAIAEKHGLTKARVNQILVDNKITDEVVNRAVASDAGVSTQESDELTKTGQVKSISSAGGSQGATGKGRVVKRTKKPAAEAIARMTEDDLQEALIEASQTMSEKELSDHWAQHELLKRFKDQEAQDEINDDMETTDELDGDLSDWDASYQSKNEAGQPTTVETIRDMLKPLFFTQSRFDNKVTVVKTFDELPPETRRSAQIDGDTQAFVLPNGRAYMIADRIDAGHELAVFLHEVGVHLGMEKMLGGKENFVRLAQQIVAWADKNDGSIEHRVANLALARTSYAAKTTLNFTDTDYMHEAVAYFVEEAVAAGINPTALSQVSSGINKWLSTLWNAVRGALRKFGLDRLDTLTAQEVVDLAFGAAHLNMVGRNTEGEIGRAVRFSRKADPSTPDGFFSRMGAALDDLAANPKGWFKEHGLGWMTLEQIADSVKSAAVKQYVGVMTKIQQFSKDRINAASEIDRTWAKLSYEQQDSLSDVMRKATRLGFDPAENPATNLEESALKAKWNSLGASAQQVYRQVRDYYSSNFEERKAIMMEAANKARENGKNVAETERLFKQLKESRGPYFPLMRLGNWYAVGMSNEMAELQAKVEDGAATAEEQDRYNELRKDDKHYVTSSFNSRREARKASEEMRQRLGNSYFNVAEERIRNEVAKIPDIATLEEYMAGDLPGATRSEIREMLTQMYFDMLPENSALKRLMKREGVHGEEQDMRKVFAASTISQAHHISRLKYANELDASMVAVRNDGRKDETKRMIANELDKRTSIAMQNDSNPVIDRIQQWSYFAHLGLSPAFVLTNMTQVPMITAPYLGARHGMGKAGNALASALGDTLKILKATYPNLKEDWRNEVDWHSLFKQGSNEDRLITDLLDRNIIDITIEHDFGAVAIQGQGKTGKSITDIKQVFNLPVRVTETANRLITALAAYRLEMDRLGKNGKAMTEEQRHQASVEAAAKAVSETQLNYSALNAPRHMQSVLGSKALAKLMFQFRKYQQGMVYLIVNNAKEALKGATPEERKVARNTLFGLMATTGLMAGATGMPFAGSVFWLASVLGGLGGDDDEPFDAEIAFANFLSDNLPHPVADVLRKGLPTLVNADLSNNVGMGNIGMPFPFLRDGKKPSDSLKNMLIASAGAPFGTILDTADGLGQILNGDFLGGAQKVMPIRAAQNMIKAYGYANEGMLDSRGNIIMPSEQFSPWDIALRGAGFTTATESNYFQANNAVQTAKKAAEDTRSNLLREYAEARLKGEDTSDFQVKIMDFNTRHPEKGTRIDQSALLKSVEERRRISQSRNSAGVRNDKRTAPYMNRARFAERD